jgi:CheY-like chemotaxis protein/HPt (histidine-containing phosphotransfer) domain-containing protein
MRILVADDAAYNLLLIQSYLKDPSFAVDTAPNGSVALEKFQSGSYDLVLMDIHMPVMDGYTATQRIRAWETEHQKPRAAVLALTANSFEEERQASLAAGCDAHLVKPIRKAELLEAIRAHTRACQVDATHADAGERISVRPPAGIEEAVPLFLESTREDLEALSRFLNELDFPKIRFIGHDLKGSGGGYGFDPISVIGKAIEEAAKLSDGEEILRQIAVLKNYLDRVDVVLD